jgi:murein DD-endopeptidase MepM/ murein hydrolase activator NlpD
MRRLVFVLCALMLPAAPAAASGGALAPSSSGGTEYGELDRASSRPVAALFTVAPATIAASRPTTFTFQVDGRAGIVRVRIVLTRAGSSAPSKRLRLGYRRTGRRYQYVWTPAVGELPAGEYRVKLRAIDDSGRRLRRTATASGRGHLTVQVAPPAGAAAGGVFPVRGTYTFGGPEARFGAQRAGHIHQGQDIPSPEGTPLVAPLAGTVTWVKFQAGGAGYYVVLRAVDGRDFVFMHIRTGSISVAKGAPLAAGQQFAQVGNTGSSTGPHLHFEIWPDGWYSSADSRPIDPLPQLMAWAGTR